ncbi:hypothetical protein [Streptomyces sp. NBC_01367]|uniref:hypothetical protein n=1 Tax=Streptomyces sp. NBC_01367 TaxID=2903841 RepID=UPI003256082E
MASTSRSSFNNRGPALEQVIVHEWPRYYNAGDIDQAELAARGIVLNGTPRSVQAAPAPPAAVPVATEVKDAQRGLQRRGAHAGDRGDGRGEVGVLDRLGRVRWVL